MYPPSVFGFLWCLHINFWFLDGSVLLPASLPVNQNKENRINPLPFRCNSYFQLSTRHPSVLDISGQGFSAVWHHLCSPSSKLWLPLWTPHLHPSSQSRAMLTIGVSSEEKWSFDILLVAAAASQRVPQSFRAVDSQEHPAGKDLRRSEPTSCSRQDHP